MTGRVLTPSLPVYSSSNRSGQVEVELDGRHLPGAAECVLDLNGDLGTVRTRLRPDPHQSQAGSFADLGERCGRLFPDVVATDELVRVFGGQFEVEVVEAVVLEQVQNELQGGGQLVAHLLTGAVDVSVVLGHAAHAGQAVDDAGLLVAVDRAEFEEPQRQFTVRASASTEDQVVHRAVHRLEVVVLARLAHGAVLVQFLVDVHRREHAVAVPVEVTGNLVQMPLGDVRSVDELVARLDVAAARVVLHLGAG